MHAHPIIATPVHLEAIQIVDAEFDRFEMNNDFEMVTREENTAHFYHDALNDEE